jgi:hypothetical protein
MKNVQIQKIQDSNVAHSGVADPRQQTLNASASSGENEQEASERAELLAYVMARKQQLLQAQKAEVAHKPKRPLNSKQLEVLRQGREKGARGRASRKKAAAVVEQRSPLERSVAESSAECPHAYPLVRNEVLNVPATPVIQAEPSARTYLPFAESEIAESLDVALTGDKNQIESLVELLTNRDWQLAVLAIVHEHAAADCISMSAIAAVCDAFLKRYGEVPELSEHDLKEAYQRVAPHLRGAQPDYARLDEGHFMWELERMISRHLESTMRAMTPTERLKLSEVENHLCLMIFVFVEALSSKFKHSASGGPGRAKPAVGPFLNTGFVKRVLLETIADVLNWTEEKMYGYACVFASRQPTLAECIDELAANAPFKEEQYRTGLMAVWETASIIYGQLPVVAMEDIEKGRAALEAHEQQENAQLPGDFLNIAYHPMSQLPQDKETAPGSAIRHPGAFLVCWSLYEALKRNGRLIQFRRREKPATSASESPIATDPTVTVQA